MNRKELVIQSIPCLLWGEKSNKVYIYVHGKGSSKEGHLAKIIADVVIKKGYQLLSFDLPEHGQRTDEKRCDVFDGVKDLELILDEISNHFDEICVFGCSIGAYFSLQTLMNYKISKCLFLSPIIDMEYLISQMFVWFNVDVIMLEREKEIQTPIDPLRYDYYCYVKNHPLKQWTIPTSILYGAKDNLQTLEIMRKFEEKYQTHLEVSNNSEHAFMGESDDQIIKNWLIHYA